MALAYGEALVRPLRDGQGRPRAVFLRLIHCKGAN